MSNAPENSKKKWSTPSFGGYYPIKRKDYPPHDLHYTVNQYGGSTPEHRVTLSDGSTATLEDLREARQLRLNKLEALAHVQQRTDRILSGDSIVVKVVENATEEFQESARTDGRNIELNALNIPNFTDDNLVALNGLNYHELGHIIFSPRLGSEIGLFAMGEGCTTALTILEEGRSETFLLEKYPSLTPYLEASVYTTILGKHPEEEWGGLFALTTGRTYLPLELRQGIADMAVADFGLEPVKETHSIIHEYRTLVFPNDYTRGKELVKRFAELTGFDNEKSKMGNASVGHACDSPTQSRPVSPTEQKELAESGKGEGKGEGKETLNTNSDKKKKAGTGEGGEGITQEVGEEDTRTLSREVADKLNEIMESTSIRRDLRDIRTILKASERTHSSIKKAPYQERTVKSEYISTSKRFATELERLVRDNDPAWKTRVASGKLNIQRAMNPDINAIKEAFDEWDTGNEATEIEAVIIVDNSGSMGGMMEQVCSQTWVIKRGIESINGSVSAFLFNSEAERLYSREEKALPRTYRLDGARGGTYAQPALEEAENIFEASKKPIKILFMVTDGGWGNSEVSDALIADLNSKGVLTCMVFFGNLPSVQDGITKEQVEGYRKHYHHEAQIFRAVSAPNDILNVAQELVKSTLKRPK